MSRKRKILVLAAILVLALVIVCGVYVSDYYPADDTALAALESSGTQVDDMVVFAPPEPTVGFIFYPGGKVEHTAYAPLMQALAERGVMCVIAEMPLRLAVLDVNAAQGIPARFPEIGDWYIGGHSLGGSMAASFAAEHAGEFEGLILLASYSTADLNGTALDVLSVYGTADGVLDLEKYEAYAANLPENTRELVIEGGNHAGFGSYGAQAGDGEAAIAAEEQTAQTADAILAMMMAK